jgi:23S rRNA (cytidine1920-2'-O)/16S rRNA (cytidine1409-2'-O)-methyltransferase
VAVVDAELVLLVKPQFEAGPEHVGRGGVVRDPLVWRRVLGEVADACHASGIGVTAVMASPLLGPAGNAEFLLHGRKGEPDRTVDLDTAVAEGERLRR